MEQRFTWQGEQFEPRSFDYKNKHYLLDSKLPLHSGWTENVPTDVYNNYPPDQGLEDFHFFYASNTGIPGPYRPRPIQTSTPTFTANGVQQLFYDTQDLRYSTANGKPPAVPVPNFGDRLIDQYNYDNDVPRKENCGCGAGPLLPLHG